MSKPQGRHPLKSAPGLFAFVLWSVYSLDAALNYPDILTSVLVGALFGLFACVALAVNFQYWRAAVLLASSVYLVLYVVRIVRMTAIRPDLSFLSALVLYYGASWRVVAGTFEEKGWAGGLTRGFLEYAMPVLVLALIAVIVFSRPREHRRGPIEPSKP